ncbi:MAG: DJ-1/PfpI family protein [Candidatus Diapherotrites archaeon]|nr:DJ-1/PfpI family protein [Candidatus Diapherotrites archaeon]
MREIPIILFIFFLFTGCVQNSFEEDSNMVLKNKNVVMVIAPGNFRDEELFKPKEILEKAGVNVKVASLERGTYIGKLGSKADATLSLNEISVNDFDAIIFVGGPGASIYFDNNKALSLANDFYKKGKVVGAICIAPSILANSGILSGKKATAFPSEESNIKKRGAIFTGNSVEVDGKIITANGPDAAKSFGEQIVKLLK